MILVLVAEIVSALVALALVIALLVQLAPSVRAKSPAIASDESRVRHRMLSAILLVAVIVHGASATIYASGAHPLSYAFGWLALALLLASGLCMVPAIRSRLARASTWHSGFFVAAVALIVAHAVAGRL